MPGHNGHQYMTIIRTWPSCKLAPGHHVHLYMVNMYISIRPSWTRGLGHQGHQCLSTMDTSTWPSQTLVTGHHGHQYLAIVDMSYWPSSTLVPGSDIIIQEQCQCEWNGYLEKPATDFLCEFLSCQLLRKAMVLIEYSGIYCVQQWERSPGKQKKNFLSLDPLLPQRKMYLYHSARATHPHKELNCVYHFVVYTTSW